MSAVCLSLVLSPLAAHTSAPGGVTASSGTSGAQRLTTPRVTGADYFMGGGDARVVATETAVEPDGFTLRVTRPRCASARRAVAFYSRRFNEWRAKMGAGKSSGRSGSARTSGQPSGAAQADHSLSRGTCPQLRRLALRWKARAFQARRAFEAWFRRTYEKWRCIHEHEGAWNASTGNGYYGGLQMTRWFQQTYGPEFYRRFGMADRWPVWAQLVAAERAWRECSCFRQWGTAGMCGLR